MNSFWTPTKLVDLLAPVARTVKVQPLNDYSLLGIRLDGGGPFLRETKPGSAISAGSLNKVATGDFIYSRLFAWRGAFGIIGKELDGCFVSNEFPTFTPNSDKLDVKFLWHWFRLSETLKKVEADCTGSTPLTRNRYKENFFLRLEILLPPLPEQRRIVAKIEALAANIDEVRKIQHYLNEKYKWLCRSLIFDKSHGGPIPTPMSELLSLKETNVVVSPEDNYPFAGVYCFGRGVFIGERRNGFEFAYKKLTQLRAGDLVYPKLMAWEGAISIVPHECDGLFVSPEFPVFKVNTDLVLPEVLDVYFRTPSVWPLLADASTGTNVRRRRLHPQNFLKYKFPLPPTKNQNRLRQIYLKVNGINRLQTRTAAELDALLPAILDRAFKGEL